MQFPQLALKDRFLPQPKDNPDQLVERMPLLFGHFGDILINDIQEEVLPALQPRVDYTLWEFQDGDDVFQCFEEDGEALPSEVVEVFIVKLGV